MQRYELIVKRLGLVLGMEIGIGMGIEMGIGIGIDIGKIENGNGNRETLRTYFGKNCLLAFRQVS